MSNQFGLILSFIFLSLFIGMTKELFSYQSFITIFDNQAIQIVQEIQKNGYQKETIDEYANKYNFIDFNHQLKMENYYEHHIITIKKKFKSQWLNNILDKEVIRKFEIYRREVT